MKGAAIAFGHLGCSFSFYVLLTDCEQKMGLF